ncbi:hypothetical protein U1Q18_048696 [Sarracenia purpurea var. burkii]
MSTAMVSAIELGVAGGNLYLPLNPSGMLHLKGLLRSLSLTTEKEMSVAVVHGEVTLVRTLVDSPRYLSTPDRPPSRHRRNNGAGTGQLVPL